MVATITAANAVLMIQIPGLYPAPVQLQGFAADNIFDTDSVEPTERMMGVDGKLSIGWVARSVSFKVSLQADSDSNLIFETWWQTQQQQREALYATMTARLPSVGRSYQLVKGALASFPPTPNAARVLQPRQYAMEFEKLTVAPI